MMLIKTLKAVIHNDSHF